MRSHSESFHSSYIVSYFELTVPIILYEQCKLSPVAAMVLYALLGTLYALILMFGNYFYLLSCKSIKICPGLSKQKFTKQLIDSDIIKSNIIVLIPSIFLPTFHLRSSFSAAPIYFLSIILLSLILYSSPSLPIPTLLH